MVEKAAFLRAFFTLIGFLVIYDVVFNSIQVDD